MLIDTSNMKIDFKKEETRRAFVSGFAAGLSFCCFGYVIFSVLTSWYSILKYVAKAEHSIFKVLR